MFAFASKNGRLGIAVVSLLLTTQIACGGGAEDPSASATDGVGYSSDDIVNGNTEALQTKVKRQSIGNCWLYATASWVEGMHKRGTGEDLDVSETYLTYWHWFEQIANSGASTELSTGGSYGVATSLIQRYGIMREADFIPAEALAEMSGAQSRAESAINAKLAAGDLVRSGTPEEHRAKVRAALNEAFGLSAEMIAKLDEVFGADVSKTLDRAYVNAAPGSNILRAKDVVVQIPDPDTHQPKRVTLDDTIGQGSSWSRTGTYAFQEVDFPWDETERRAFQIRIQKALHDGAIPIMSWKVDFNALTSDSRFSLAELERRGPGSGGGHMVVMNDYEATLADGTVLEAGADASAENLRSALDESTTIQSFRVKNSWGAYRPDRWQTADVYGYHDLEWTYLADGNWWDVVLPAGY